MPADHSDRRTVVTIGNFEAVHSGHIELIRRARSIADAAPIPLRVVVLTFDPHPISVLKGVPPRPCLHTIERRAELLHQAGADEVVVIEPTRELLALPPEDFVQRVVEQYAPACFVEGDDFRFGRNRAGDAATLRALAAQHQFKVQIVDEVDIDLSDQTIVRASSTMTRWLIEHGRVLDAARLLTRPYQLTGTVVRGDQRGRTIGFPTANLETTCLLPADAVYAATAILPTGDLCPAAVHVGPRSTFDCVKRTVEAHLIEWTPPDPDNPYEYGWPLRLDLHRHLRDQAKFEGIEPLVEQIRSDVSRARQVLETKPSSAAQPQDATA